MTTSSVPSLSTSNPFANPASSHGVRGSNTSPSVGGTTSKNMLEASSLRPSSTPLSSNNYSAAPSSQPVSSSNKSTWEPKCNIGAWKPFFDGTGVTLNWFDTDVNISWSGQTTVYDLPAIFKCEALGKCDSDCRRANAETIELTYTGYSSSWQCSCYHGYTTNATIFEDPNPLVTKVYGYSRRLNRTTPSPPEPAPQSVTKPQCQSGHWQNFYYGRGFVLDDENPANINNSMKATTLTATATCKAISDCIAFASFINYHTIDVHLMSDKTWMCKAYKGLLNDSSYFVTTGPDATRAYGYALPQSPSQPSSSPEPSDGISIPNCTGIGNFSNFFFGKGRTMSSDGNLNLQPFKKTTLESRCRLGPSQVAQIASMDHGCYSIMNLGNGFRQPTLRTTMNMTFLPIILDGTDHPQRRMCSDC